MKKLFTVFLTFVIIVSVYADEPVLPYGTTSICPSFSCSNASNDNQSGNMFDISALTDITITGFVAQPQTGTTSYEIYYKAGSFVGNETNPSAWTLVGGATNLFSSIPNTIFLPVTINVTIPAGQTFGWYVTSTNNALKLYNTIGSQTGNIFTSNADLVFKEGVSLSYPFDTVFPNRVFDGGFQYCQAASLSTSNMENNLIAVKVFPNPVYDKAKISCDLSSMNGQVTFEAFSLLGEKVSLPQSIQGDGIVINTQSLSSGIYRFILLDGEKKLVGRGKFSVQ
jgi:hypothetical protein